MTDKKKCLHTGAAIKAHDSKYWVCSDCKQEIRHGWYGAKFAANHGTSFYRAKDGTEVEVSSVTSSADKLDWMTGDYDQDYVGLVTNWIRKGVEGRIKLERF